MNKEKCSKCCFDLKDEKIIENCEIICRQDKHCSEKLITCYTLEHIGE